MPYVKPQCIVYIQNIRSHNIRSNKYCEPVCSIYIICIVVILYTPCSDGFTRSYGTDGVSMRARAACG